MLFFFSFWFPRRRHPRRLPCPRRVTHLRCPSQATSLWTPTTWAWRGCAGSRWRTPRARSGVRWELMPKFHISVEVNSDPPKKRNPAKNNLWILSHLGSECSHSSHGRERPTHALCCVSGESLGSGLCKQINTVDLVHLFRLKVLLCPTFATKFRRGWS